MSKVIYDSKRIIPAPLVTFDKSYQTTGDGEKIGSLFTLTLTGSILSFKGSPDSTGTFWTLGGFPPDETPIADQKLGVMFRKQEAIRDLFSVDGLQFEAQSADGSQPLKCNPRVKSINFSEGQWFDRVTYTIVLEADVVYVNGTLLGEDEFTDFISSASESWSMETDESQAENELSPRTYRLSHTVNATGKRFYDENGLVKEAWKQARDWVLPKLGFDAAVVLSSGVSNLPSYYQGFNHVRSENYDVNGGNFSVSETWLISSGSASEDFTINTNAGEDGITQVEVNGNINGFEQRNITLGLTTTKYTNAISKFNTVVNQIFDRAKAFSGITTLNFIPLSTVIGRNPIAGTINYNYTYNNRAGNLVTGTKSESISISNNWEVDIFASIGVLGRAAGPVLQNINTKQATTRSLNVELVFGSSFAGTGNNPTTLLITKNPRFVEPQKSEIQALVSAVHPVLAGSLNNVGVAATTAFVGNQSESWEFKTGRYSYNVEWTYE